MVSPTSEPGEGNSSRRPGRRVRLLLVLALVLALVPTGLLVAHRILTPRDHLDTVAPGSLSVAGEANGEWSVGAARVVLDHHRLAITEGDLVVWASTPDEAFLTGARGAVDWQEHRGYFWPTMELTTSFTDQRIDTVRVEADSLVLSGTLTGDGVSVGWSMEIVARDGGGVTVDVGTDDDLDALGLHSARSDHAGVHGFGAQFSDFDLDGRLIPIVTREQGVGRGLQPLTFLADLTEGGLGGTSSMTYGAWSSFLTEDLRGVSLDPVVDDSHAFAVADTRDPARVDLHLWASRLRADLVAATTPTGLIAAQQGAIDRPELAEWTQDGAILGLQGGTDAVREHVANLTEAGTPVSAVWLQDWTGQRTTSFGDRLWWTWQLDQDRYPGWEGLVAELAEQGIRTTTYVNPFLTDAIDKPGTPVRNLWAEARDAGYLVRTAEGEPYELDQGGFAATLVDLTNPAARDWFAQVIADDVLGQGVDGFMADFAEGLPFDAVLTDGDPALMHNRWPALWAETVAHACELADKPDCVTWFRSGSLGMAGESALFWTGDQLVDFGPEDGLASALLGSFSSGVSGWPLSHSDVGGYTSINAVVRNYVRPDDLLQRWTEFAAFGVVLRTHEGNRPAENLQVYDSPASREAFARMTRVFTALAPYRAGVLAEAQRTGVPAIRHGWLVHPGTASAEVDTQFFLGDAILVAPVLSSGATTVEVSFPPGRWVHLFTGEVYEGDRVTEVEAPLGTPAAFVAADDPRADGLRDAVRSATN